MVNSNLKAQLRIVFFSKKSWYLGYLPPQNENEKALD